MPTSNVSDLGAVATTNRPGNLLGELVADRVCPVTKVDRMTGSLRVPSVAACRHPQGGIVAEGGEPDQATHLITEVAFNLERRAARVPIPQRAGPIAEARDAARELAIDQVRFSREIEVAGLIQSTPNWAANDAVGTAWTEAGALPISDLDGACRTFIAQAGVWPNTVVLNGQAWAYASGTAEVSAVIDAAASVTPEIAMAHRLRLAQFVIADAMESSEMDASNATFTPAWSQAYAWIGYLNLDSDIVRPSACYLPELHRDDMLGISMREWSDRRSTATHMDARVYDRPIVTDAQLGFVLTGLYS